MPEYCEGVSVISLVYNKSDSENHLSRITGHAAKAQKIVIVSGWIKDAGVELLAPVLSDAIKRGATIVVLSNGKKDGRQEMTEQGAVNRLCSIGATHHRVSEPYLLTKLHYFEMPDHRYAALIGSANITRGALIENEELSTEILGFVQDEQHEQIREYLSFLEARLSKRNITLGLAGPPTLIAAQPGQ
jgi:HKD family nuclease